MLIVRLRAGDTLDIQTVDSETEGRTMRDEALAKEIEEAERKALDSLARYKFQMFGYWAGIWVHLNRIEGKRRPSPFAELVKKARELQSVANRGSDALRLELSDCDSALP